jgi:catechol 2,3-dioxygenase-like lactoylglutathione lyase family enzyme
LHTGTGAISASGAAAHRAIAALEPAAAVHAVDHFAWQAPKLDDELCQLRAFGLRVQRDADRLLLRTASSAHVWGIVLHGSHRQLAYVAMAGHIGELGQLRRQVCDANGRLEARHPNGTTEGFWFSDPDGLLFQVVERPAAHAEAHSGQAAEGLAGRRPGHEPRVPVRMSHLSLSTPSVRRALDFHRRALGLRAAAGSSDALAFTLAHTGDASGPLLAFLAGGGAGLHQSVWELPATDSGNGRCGGWRIMAGVGAPASPRRALVTTLNA